MEFHEIEKGPVENQIVTPKSIIMSKSKQAVVTLKEDGSKEFSCLECPNKYGDKELMEMHLCVHNSEYRFLCDNCGTGFKRKIHYERHILEHQEIRPFICELCTRTFKRKEHLTSHRNKMHKSSNSVKQFEKIKMTVVSYTEDGTCLFSCTECPKTFRDKEEMALHLCVHNKEYRFLCIICGTGLKRKEHLERHMLEHQDIRPHPCTECGKSFKRKEHLTIHLNIHTNHRDQVCQICDRSFHRKDHLQKHLQTHRSLLNAVSLKKEEPIEYSEEPMDLEDMETSDMPVITEVTGKGLDISTLIMEQGMEAARNIIRIPIDSRDPERPFACPVCFKTYKRRDHMRLHSQTHLKTKPCSECGQMFHTEQQLLVHMDQHIHGILEGTLDSALIIDETQQDPLAEDHEDTSNSLLTPLVKQKKQDERPHECSICFKRFKRKQHLNLHYNIHKKNAEKEVTIWCSICYKGFHNNAEFESHQHSSGCEEDNTADCENNYNQPPEDYQFQPQIVQEESNQPQDPLAAAPPANLYVCPDCGKPFRRKDHYKIHLNIHTGVRPFLCPSCDKSFYRKDHLQKHMQVHERRPRKKPVPELLPITQLTRILSNLTEITVHAPSSSKLRFPLQIKPHQQMSTEDGVTRHYNQNS